MENTIINEVILEHIDVEITLVLDIKIDIREAFQNLYSETFYSLYPDLFAELDKMLLNGALLEFFFGGTNSLRVYFYNKMHIKDEGLDGRKLLTSFDLYSMDTILVYFEKEWEIYEIF